MRPGAGQTEGKSGFPKPARQTTLHKQ